MRGSELENKLMGRNKQQRHRVEADEASRVQFTETSQGSPTKLDKQARLNAMYKESYRPAQYSRAETYRDERSYKIKDNEGQYHALSLFEDTKKLQSFGLGPYFFVEMFRRMCWLLLILSLFEAIRLYCCFKGSQLNTGMLSYSTYLITLSVGNYTRNAAFQYDGYFIVSIPGLSYLTLWVFYLIWKAHFASEIENQDQDTKVIKPEKFCLEVEGFGDKLMSEDELEPIFRSFGELYQISLVREYGDHLSFFEDLDELEEQIKEEELEMILGYGDKDELNQLKMKKLKLMEEMERLRIVPHIKSAFIHFQYEKSKINCEDYFNNHYLFNTVPHSCMRSLCCCCLQTPDPQFSFKGEQILIKNNKVPDPIDINWLSNELGFCSKFWRVFIAAIVIIVFLALSCLLIGLGSVYLNGQTGNCTSTPKTLIQAKVALQSEQRCYCIANIILTFTDTSIQSFCGPYTEKIYISQAIQYAVVFTSIIVNVLFGVAVDKLVDCVRPPSQSAALQYKSMVYTVFLIINSVLLPILTFAKIFGVKTAQYLSFITLFSTDIRTVLNVDNLSFEVDFSGSWYQNVSPIFTTFIVIDTITVWLFFLLNKCIASKVSLEDEQNRMLQKKMNNQITSFKVNVFKETASFYMMVFLVFFLQGGMPALLPLGLINILSRYITLRHLLQNDSSRIEGLGTDFNQIGHYLLPIFIVFGSLLGNWMLTATKQLYVEGANILGTALPLPNYFQVFQREFYLSFFLIIAVLAVLEFFFYNTLVRMFSWCASLCYNRKELTQHSVALKPFSHHSRKMNRQVSFNIRNNDHFRNPIINLEKYLLAFNKL